MNSNVDPLGPLLVSGLPNQTKIKLPANAQKVDRVANGCFSKFTANLPMIGALVCGGIGGAAIGSGIVGLVFVGAPIILGIGIGALSGAVLIAAICKIASRSFSRVPVVSKKDLTKDPIDIPITKLGRLEDYHNKYIEGKGYISDKTQSQISSSLMAALQKSSEDASKTQVIETLDLEKVTDPNEVHVLSKTLLCAWKADERPTHKFCRKLDFAVAMRKGSYSLPTPKAMGEDAFVLDYVTINVNNFTYCLPIMATLDGGGGHALAQYGQTHLKNLFQKNLRNLANKSNHINDLIIAEAMRQTDAEMFSRGELIDNHFSSKAYTDLLARHTSVNDKLKVLNVDQFKTIFKKLKGLDGQLLGKNPREIGDLLLRNAQIPNQTWDIQTGLTFSIRNLDSRTFFEIGDYTWDLKNSIDLLELQSLYEDSQGTMLEIEVEVVMTAFLLNPNCSIQCVTYNRGDSMALLHQESKILPLSEQVSPMRVNTSSIVLKEGAQVISLSDGVSDVLSIYELEEANNSEFLKNQSSKDYVQKLMLASILTGSGDDKTIISAKLESRPILNK